MKTNRPEGIFQGNRTEPLFILLRHYADEESEIAVKLTKEFAILSIAQFISGCIPLIVSIFYPQFLILSIGLCAIIAIITIGNYFHLKRRLADLTQHEVDRLLQTDEYRYAAINGEDLFNKAAQTLKSTGKLEECFVYFRLCFVCINLMSLLFILMQCDVIFMR